MEITIEQLKTFSPDITTAINNLLAQLSKDAKELDRNDIKGMIESKSNTLIVAKNSSDQKIIGMLTLVSYSTPIGKKAWLEDLVVDQNYRERGIATKLINFAIDKAKQIGATSLNLTSRPERIKANKVYIKLGFQRRNTNVYKIEL